MQRDIRTTPLYQAIARHFEDLYAPGTAQFHGITDVAPHPRDATVAFAGTMFDEGGGFPRSRIGLVDAAGTAPRLFRCTDANDTQPCWSPDGRQLAFLSDGGGGTGNLKAWIATLADQAALRACPSLGDQVVETLRWSPDGMRLLLQTAGAGADAAGSAATATIGSRAADLPSWIPRVEPSDDDNAWRYCWIWDLRTDALHRVGQDGLTVWEAVWRGNDAVAAIVSENPSEGGWYAPSIAIASAAGGDFEVVHVASDQLATPAASPDGRYIAFLAGSFHRVVSIGKPAIYDVAAGKLLDLPDFGVEASALHWRDATRLFFIGLQSLETRAGTFDVARSSVDLEWRSAWSCGRKIPMAWPRGRAGCVLAAHGAMRHPYLLAVGDDGAETVLADFATDGARRIVATYDDVRELAWKGRDGLDIHGLLATPSARNFPVPLVTFIHGGPVHVFRNVWNFDNPLIALLIRQGYAVLLPNPRGSSGRSQAFARLVRGDMGGEDTHDILAGIDAAVGAGVADPQRLLVAGGSYGGYMTSWLVTHSDRFAAACAIAPLTHMRSQYFTAHHPEFLAMYAGDGPYAVGGRFDTRSPITFANQARTPTLCIAGGCDRTTPSSQAVEFHHALRQQGVPTELAIYPEEGHAVARYEAQIDQGARVVDWFARHVGRLAGRN